MLKTIRGMSDSLQSVKAVMSMIRRFRSITSLPWIVVNNVGPRVLFRIRAKHAVHASPFQYHVGINFQRTKRGGRVRREVRISCAGPKNDDASLFEMPDRSSPNEWFGNLLHLDARQQPGVHARLLEGILERHGVDHGRKHAHVVGMSSRHARRRVVHAAKYVAAANDNRDLYTFINDRLDLPCVGREDLVVYAILLVTEQRFAAQFQHDPFVTQARFAGFRHVFEALIG